MFCEKEIDVGRCKLCFGGMVVGSGGRVGGIEGSRVLQSEEVIRCLASEQAI